LAAGPAGGGGTEQALELARKDVYKRQKYAKDNPEFSFKAGLVEGRVITVKEIESLATMPSKEELYSKLLFLLNAPSQRLVTAMNAVGRNLAVVIGQGVEQKKFKEA